MAPPDPDDRKRRGSHEGDRVPGARAPWRFEVLEAAGRRVEAAEGGPSPSLAPPLQYARHDIGVHGDRADIRFLCLIR